MLNRILAEQPIDKSQVGAGAYCICARIQHTTTLQSAGLGSEVPAASVSPNPSPSCKHANL